MTIAASGRLCRDASEVLNGNPQLQATMYGMVEAGGLDHEKNYRLVIDAMHMEEIPK